MSEQGTVPEDKAGITNKRGGGVKRMIFELCNSAQG